MCPCSAFSDQRAQRGWGSLRRYGFDMELTDLVYDGERSSLIEYLTARGWEVRAQSLAEAYAANGFELPHDEMFAAFADARTISGVLRH